jgi:signal transduction histidine kinase
MLRLDHPQLGKPGEEFAGLLQGAIDHVRDLMVELDPHPVGATGLNSSLLQLSERFRRTFSVVVEVEYRAQTPVIRVVSEDIVWLSARVLQTASQAGAERIVVQVTGRRTIKVRAVVFWTQGRHRGAARAFEPVRYLAESAGFRFGLQAGKNTVITIHHDG